MNTQEQRFDDFITLMQNYTTFLEKMLADEKDRFAALASLELPRIEHCIAVSQANAKQLQNYEAKRIETQRMAGFDGMSFRDLLQKLPLEEQGVLEPLFVRFGSMVEEIRFNNDKSMALARDNMTSISPEIIAASGGKAPNPYDKMMQTERGNILKTKI